MAIATMPCDWPINTDCCGTAWEDASPERRAFAAAVATELVWRLSGRRFGLCQQTVRPCRRDCATSEPTWPPPYGTSFWPVLSGGSWTNLACGSCKRGCSCEVLEEVVLPGPIHAVSEVWVDGVQLPAGAYQVHDHRLLVRVDGGAWPKCQDLTAEPNEPGSFAVVYDQGIPVPPGGQYAAGVYACELLASCTGGTCRLPKRVQTITRQGVTAAFLDPMDFLEKGLTGVPEVDAWISAVNPHKSQGPSRVYSPDLSPPRRITS